MMMMIETFSLNQNVIIDDPIGKEQTTLICIDMHFAINRDNVLHLLIFIIQFRHNT